ncbi:MAG: hypothetical protein JXA58_06305 [Dehalococcoidia bacterium]|nr:hypothetical protein [Dehalococcoidia bacterium]
MRRFLRSTRSRMAGVRQIALQHAGVLAAAVGAVLSAGVAIWSFLTGNRQEILGVAVLALCVAHLAMRHRELHSGVASTTRMLSGEAFALDTVFFILLSLTWIAWHESLYVRPLLHFVLVSALPSLVVVDVVKGIRGRRVVWTLVKVIFIGWTIRYGQFYVFPSLSGYDAYSHASLAEYVLWLGHVPSVEVAGQYAVSSGLHVAVSSLAILSSITVKNAMFVLFGGVLTVVQSLGLFLMGKRLHSPRAGLLAALLGAVSTQLILRSVVNITPGSMVLIFFALIWLAVTFRNRGAVGRGLVLIFMLAAVVTHQLTPFVMLVCLLVFSLALHFTGCCGDRFGVGLRLVVVFAAMLTVAWGLTPGYLEHTFWENQLRTFLDVLVSGGAYGESVLVVGVTQTRNILDELVLQLSIVAPLLLGIGAALFFLEKPSTPAHLALGLTVLVLLAVVYVPPALGVRAFLTDRWLPMLEYVWLPLAGVWLASAWSAPWCMSGAGRLVPVLAIGLFAFASITLPVVNKDNPLVNEDSTVRNQFKASEIVAAQWTVRAAARLVVTDGAFRNALMYEATRHASERLRASLVEVDGTLLSESHVAAEDALVTLRTAVYGEAMPESTALMGVVTTSRLSATDIQSIRRTWRGVVYASNQAEVGAT